MEKVLEARVRPRSMKRRVFGFGLLRDLKLILHIDRESYATRISGSAKDPNTAHEQLTLTLRLHFTNQTKTVARVQKNCVHLASTVVYDSPLVGPPEALLPPNGMIAESSPNCPYMADGKLLPLLPGKSFETKMQIKFQIIDHGSFHPAQSLRPGPYFLAIDVATWWQIDGQDDDFKEKWRKPGVFASRTVHSELMAFVVEGNLSRGGPNYDGSR